MGKTLRKLEWGKVLLAGVSVGVLLGYGVLAFADSDPVRPPAPIYKLTGDQAIAFRGGYIQAVPEPLAATVLGMREAKQFFSSGEVEFLKIKPTVDVKVGDALTVFRPAKRIYHPITREYMGEVIRILGVLEITRESREGVAEARVVQSFDAMSRDDRLKLFAPPPPVPTQQVTSGPLTGIIVDFKEPLDVTSQDEIVYIDRGEMDGVALGDRFSVLRPGRRQSGTDKTPDLPVAEIKVVGLQAHTATAYVVNSHEGLSRGDIVNRLPPPPPKAAADSEASEGREATPAK